MNVSDFLVSDPEPIRSRYRLYQAILLAGSLLFGLAAAFFALRNLFGPLVPSHFDLFGTIIFGLFSALLYAGRKSSISPVAELSDHEMSQFFKSIQEFDPDPAVGSALAALSESDRPIYQIEKERILSHLRAKGAQVEQNRGRRDLKGVARELSSSISHHHRCA